MVILQGKSVSGGISFGRISFFEREKSEVRRVHIEDADAEIARFETARDMATVELSALFEKAEREIGPLEAQIFSIHKMMLEDADYNESVISIIKNQKLNAEAAVLMTSEIFSEMFLSTGDSYMQSRAADVSDVSERVISVLSGGEKNADAVEDNTIIFADDLAPSETLQMDKTKIIAFVTERGSTNSHTAILARSLNIPAVIGVSGMFEPNFDGKSVAVDGYEGKIYIEPDEPTLVRLQKIKEKTDKRNELLKNFKDKPTISASGKKINLFANIASPADVGKALLNDAEGIGLYRSEFLYLENTDFPSEDTQFEAYLAVTRPMGEKPVIIRTLDIGADKNVNYFNLPKEENSALGMRAIRYCLKNTDVFKTQLRAILRASAFGNVMIMLPMIVSKEEILAAKELLAEAKAELRAENIPFSEDIKVGIMIETPAAVLISDILAKECDFFSIGTNDLSQYLLAMDRQNDSLSDIFNPYHDAIFKSIAITIENAHKAGIWVGVCGELAGDTNAILRLCELGVDELSVSSQKVLEVRKIIIEG